MVIGEKQPRNACEYPQTTQQPIAAPMNQQRQGVNYGSAAFLAGQPAVVGLQSTTSS